jgi:hypothetical protein
MSSKTRARSTAAIGLTFCALAMIGCGKDNSVKIETPQNTTIMDTNRVEIDHNEYRANAVYIGSAGNDGRLQSAMEKICEKSPASQAEGNEKCHTVTTIIVQNSEKENQEEYPSGDTVKYSGDSSRNGIRLRQEYDKLLKKK